jgi:hypothetical protein
MDPSLPRGLAGSSVQIVVTVNSDWSKPVRIELPAPLALDETTPASRMLPPIRKTLEHLLALYRQPRRQPDIPWELQWVPDPAQVQTADDLQNYLNTGIPPRGITWMIRPPSSGVGRFPVKVIADGCLPVTVKFERGGRTRFADQGSADCLSAARAKTGVLATAGRSGPPRSTAFGRGAGRYGYWMVVALHPRLPAGFVSVKSRAQSGLMGGAGDFLTIKRAS